MQVVSVERVEEAVDTGNLLRNGDFHQWWAGAPVPNGFMPPSPDYAQVQRVEDEGTHVLVQGWLKAEREPDLESCLRASSGALEEGKRYEVELSAAATPGRVVSLDLWQQAKDGLGQLVEPDLLQLQPSQSAIKTYRATFTAKQAGPAALAASAMGAGMPESAVAWLEWRLSRADGASP